MRISDWSSDGCSSDLARALSQPRHDVLHPRPRGRRHAVPVAQAGRPLGGAELGRGGAPGGGPCRRAQGVGEIGRAWGRESGGQYDLISEVAVSSKTKTKTRQRKHRLTNKRIYK